MSAWLGSQAVLAWQFNSEYLTLHHTARLGCKQQPASSKAGKACVTLGLGCEAHLKTTHKQKAHLEVVILEKGRWHGLVVSNCKKKPTRIPWWKQLPRALNSESVMVGVCCVAPGQTVIRNSWNLRFLSFFLCSNHLREKKKQVGKTGSLININIVMCERKRQERPIWFSCFQPLLGIFSLSISPFFSPFASVFLCKYR